MRRGLVGRRRKPECPSLGGSSTAWAEGFQGCWVSDRVGTPKREVPSEHTDHAGEPTRRPARRPRHPRPAARRERTIDLLLVGQERSGEGALAQVISPDTTAMGVHSNWRVYKKRVCTIIHVDQ